MKALSDLTLYELKKCQNTYDEVLSQAGKLCFQDYNTAFVLFPNAINEEIKKRESKGEEK